MADSPTPLRVAVIGGGITGLAAAWELAGSGDPVEVAVWEADGRLGGKIRTDPFAGQTVEAGPDAFLARVPHAVDLCRELGLAGELVAPGAARAYLWTRGRVRALPEGLVLGVPSDLPGLARSGVLSPIGLARAGLDLVLPRTRVRGDVSVGELVAARFGREASDRLVDPLLGGIHAGTIDHLSAAATAPQLMAAVAQHRSLLVGLRGQLAAQRRAEAEAGAALHQDGGPGGPPPIFLTPRAGLSRMVAALEEGLAARGVALHTARSVMSIRPTADRQWTLATADGPAEVDAVIITTPAAAAARLLEGVAPAAARLLAGIEHASVALVTMAWPGALAPTPPGGSGLLIPRVDGHLMTACSWYTAKWPHTAQAGRVVLRVSAGRWGDGRAMALDDDALVATLRAELGAALGIDAAPEAVRVTRWPDGFPQYSPGHLDRVDRIESEIARLPGLAVAGAAYRGVGIPACIASGRQAARTVLDRRAPAGTGITDSP